MPNPKLLVVGHARHGKDSVCDILRSHFGFEFESSSQTCMRLFIFDALKDKYGYANYAECHADCHASAERRAEWFNLISEFNAGDGARLGKLIFSEFDIYCGLRNDREFFAMKDQGVFDFLIWVDRSKILPPEPASSMKIQRNWADFEIDNNGTPEQLVENTQAVIGNLLQGFHC